MSASRQPAPFASSALSKASEFYRKYRRNRPIPGTMKQLALDLVSLPLPTLDNFIAGRNGELLANLRRFAARPAGECFLYVWGRPGSGRTHLLKGAVTELQHAGTAAVYLSCAPDTRLANGLDRVDCVVLD